MDGWTALLNAPVAPTWLGISLLLGLMIRILALSRTNSDQWAVSAKIERQRAGRWITYRAPDSILSGLHMYPQLVHFVASRFPRRFSAMAAFAMTLLPDLMVASAVYLAVSATLYSRGALANDHITAYALGATLVFLFLPILVPGNARTGASNGRALGLLFSSSYFVLIGISLEGGSAWCLAPATLLCGLVVFTSSFGMQAVFSFSLLIALFALSWQPLLPIVATAIIGFAFPSLGIRDLLIGKLNHFIWYWRNPEGTVVDSRVFLRVLIEFPMALFGDLAHAKKLFLSQAPLLIAAYSVPPLWILLAALSPSGEPALLTTFAVPHFCSLIILSSALVFVATSLGRLKIFGEAERYFEYSAPMLCVLVAILGAEHEVVSAQGLLLLALIEGCIIALLYLIADTTFVDRMFSGLARSREVEDLVAFLEQLPGEVRAGALPIKLPDLLSVHTMDLLGPDGRPKIKYYYRLVLKDPRRLDGFREFENDAEELQVFRGDPSVIADRYGLDTLIADSRWMKKKAETQFVRGLERLVPSYENAKYRVYRVGRATSERPPPKRKGLWATEQVPVSPGAAP